MKELDICNFECWAFLNVEKNKLQFYMLVAGLVQLVTFPSMF